MNFESLINHAHSFELVSLIIERRKRPGILPQCPAFKPENLRTILAGKFTLVVLERAVDCVEVDTERMRMLVCRFCFREWRKEGMRRSEFRGA